MCYTVTSKQNNRPITAAHTFFTEANGRTGKVIVYRDKTEDIKIKEKIKYEN